MKTYQIDIHNLTFDTIIGILPKERIEKQRVIVNLSFKYQFDSSKNDFIDYSEVANLITKTFIHQEFELIEDGLVFIEKLLYETYPLQNLNLMITKPDILKDCEVSVSLTK
jgi:7,8-dihydroneopterin aldolase/epimerase/oxygenase